MTTWTDSSLIAFVDGELGSDQSTQLQAALMTDNALQQRLAAITQQRARVAAAFAPVLDEPIPDRLSQLLRAPAGTATVPTVTIPTPTVIDLDAARAKKEQHVAEPAVFTVAPRRAVPTWAQWGGMAASVVLGVLIGIQLKLSTDDADLGLQGGRLVASGIIEKSLTTQLASESGRGTPVTVQLSFVDKRGQYCRTFSTAQMAGLACQEQGQWAVQHLAVIDATPNTGMRQANSALPRTLLDAVDQRIAGDALDADGERTARAKGWRR